MSLTRLATRDAALVRRSRYGDRGAARRLAARHLERVSLLASVVAATPEQAAPLARQGFTLALRGQRPFESALIVAFGRLAARDPDPDAARGRLLVLLVEVEQVPLREASRLLGLDVMRAGALLPAALAAAGPAHPTRPCRGWGLVARREGLTSAERQAGGDHAALCRRCRDRLSALERTRAQLLGGSAGVVGAIAVTQLVPLGGSAAAGAGTLVASKAAAGLVGSLGAAVLVTGSAMAVTQQVRHPAPQPAHSAPSDRAPALPLTPTVAPNCGSPCVPQPSPQPSPQSSPTSATLPSLPGRDPSTTETAPPLPLLPLPLPTSLPVLPSLKPLPEVLSSLLPLL